MNTTQKILDQLPVLKKRKEPTVALVIGLLFGGLGLGIYFRSIVDFVAPIATFFALTFVSYGAQIQNLGLIGGALVAAVYGYFRAQNSNERLSAGTAERVLPEGATVSAG
jgi:hypothetical protein